MQMNSLMENHYKRLKNWHSLELPIDLAKIVHSPFDEINHCFLLRSLNLKYTNAKLSDFPDKTGFEAFINHFHLDDFVSDEFLEYSFKVIHEVFANYHSHFTTPLIQAIVSINSSGCSIRFHALRPNEVWLDNNLESYEEDALLVMNSESAGKRIS
jgi:hypothetical protein